MARSRRPINLPAPYLRRIWLDPERVPGRDRYPFALPAFRDGFELSFERPITIVVGENGTGKSTLLEAIATLIGYDEAGGGLGYRPVDHASAIEATGGELAVALKAAWLPRLRNGWFFKAESFFSVARYLDEAAKGQGPPPDFLSHSHGEGFLRFFEERCKRQGVYIFEFVTSQQLDDAFGPRRVDQLDERNLETNLNMNEFLYGGLINTPMTAIDYAYNIMQSSPNTSSIPAKALSAEEISGVWHISHLSDGDAPPEELLTFCRLSGRILSGIV